MTTQHAMAHYRSVGAYGAAAAEDRVSLIMRIMDAAAESLSTARGCIDRKDPARKGEALKRAIALIDGLRASLDAEQGGEIAANLDALYDYMTRRLAEANLKDDTVMVDEVASLLRELKTAWEVVAEDRTQP